MSKHTPGPWDAAIEHGCHAVIAAVAGEPKAVAIVGNRTPDDGYEATRFANARLIAAAPELLEALRITRGNVASLGPAGALEPYAPYREWLAMIDAAIAKATGEHT